MQIALLENALRRPSWGDIDLSQHAELPNLASLKVFALNENEAAPRRIRERPAQAVLGRTPGKSPLEPGQIPMKLTSMAEAATPPLTKRRAADAAYDAIEVLFSTLQLAPCSPGVK